MVSPIFGVTVFLVLLLFAVQLVLNLYGASAVTAVAFDGARRVATSDGSIDAVLDAEARVRGVLDRFEDRGGTLQLDWDLTRADVVVLTVTVERPRLLDRVPVPFQRVERTAVVRREVRR